jgi:hypothetical protein
MKTNFVKNITKLATVIGALFAANIANASIAANLPSANYSSSAHFGSFTAQVAFNGGQWNAGHFGNQWLQVDLNSTQAISEVAFSTIQFPSGITSESIYISDHYIGSNWASLTATAFTSGFTTNHTALSFNFAPVQGRYVEIVANGGPSWTSVANISVSAVPEPEAYSMLLGGLGLLGLMARRRMPRSGHVAFSVTRMA